MPSPSHDPTGWRSQHPLPDLGSSSSRSRSFSSPSSPSPSLSSSQPPSPLRFTATTSLILWSSRRISPSTHSQRQLSSSQPSLSKLATPPSGSHPAQPPQSQIHSKGNINILSPEYHSYATIGAQPQAQAQPRQRTPRGRTRSFPLPYLLRPRQDASDSSGGEGGEAEEPDLLNESPKSSTNKTIGGGRGNFKHHAVGTGAGSASTWSRRPRSSLFVSSSSLFIPFSPTKTDSSHLPSSPFLPFFFTPWNGTLPPPILSTLPPLQPQMIHPPNDAPPLHLTILPLSAGYSASPSQSRPPSSHSEDDDDEEEEEKHKLDSDSKERHEPGVRWRSTKMEGGKNGEGLRREGGGGR